MESSIDFATGLATDLSNVTNVTGASSPTTIEEAQDFVDFVATEGKAFIDETKSGADENENSIVTKLQNAGYTFSTYDEESHTCFSDQMNSEYSVAVEVVKLYQGYVNQSQRFTQIIVFKTVDQATQIYYARRDNPNEIGYYFRSKAVFVYTASLDTYQLLTQGT